MAAQELTLDRAVGAFSKELRHLHIRPLRILLFGSWARREQHEGSDIDLVVISPDFRGKGLRRRLELLGTAAARTLVPVQALGYTPEELEGRSPGGFLDEILSKEAVPVETV
ncbi:MAG: nucleotidyltransferase domain-containing protein [Candidatus Binatia bacterium]